MKHIDRVALLEHINNAATDLFDQGGVVPSGVLVILRDEIEAGKFDVSDTAEPVNEPFGNTAKLDSQQIEDIWHKADCSRGDEAHLRDDIFEVINSHNALLEENRNMQEELDTAYTAYEKLQKEYERLDAAAADDLDQLQSIQQERDKLANGIKAIARDTEDPITEDFARSLIQEIGVGEERT